MKYKAVIVEDELMNSDFLKHLLAEFCPQVEVAAVAANVETAVACIQQHAPQLIFMDIELQTATGFDVLQQVQDADFEVIFTTAYDQYALRAFEVHAVDYLLKPFSEERFAEALFRARGRVSGSEPREPDVDALIAEARPRQGPLERVLIRDGAQVHVLPVERIDYVEAQDDYVCFVADGRSYLKDQTMTTVEGQLDPMRFVRVHRSYLLNIERIARVELYAKDSRVAILHDGRKLPVSRAGYARLAKLL